MSVVSPTPCQCNWPLWPYGERYSPGVSPFCGERKAGKGPYCDEHAALAVSAGTNSERTAPVVLRQLTARGL